jgi:hypothetical protein
MKLCRQTGDWVPIFLPLTGDGGWLILGADLRLTELAVYVTEGSAVWEELVPFISSDTLFRLGLNIWIILASEAIHNKYTKITFGVLRWDFELVSVWDS